MPSDSEFTPEVWRSFMERVRNEQPRPLPPLVVPASVVHEEWWKRGVREGWIVLDPH